jgi:hypothetical protein
VRISDDPEYLRQVLTRAGEAPDVVLKATYGRCWAADTLTEHGAPSSVGSGKRRVPVWLASAPPALFVPAEQLSDRLHALGSNERHG